MFFNWNTISDRDLQNEMAGSVLEKKVPMVTFVSEDMELAGKVSPLQARL